MEEGAGMPPHRSASLRPQIQPTEESAGATCRRNPCLRPQIQANEDDAGVTCRLSRGTSPVALESLPFNDDMLREILIRLPPLPSSLPRASAVCKRWLGLVTDPKFHRQFYAHHRKPPLLGVFSQRYQGRGIVFNPILDPPDRIPPQRFDLGHCSSDDYNLLDCRHGLVLVRNGSPTDVVVHSPVTSEQHRLAIPPEFQKRLLKGAVFCAAGDQGHVHGSCHSSPFKVVLISSVYKQYDQPFACVYISETGIWGNLILTEAPCDVCGKSAVLVGNCLYWLSVGDDILEFDLGEHSLTVIGRPPVSDDIFLINCQIIQAEHGAVGYAELSYPRFQMWQRNVNGHGVATWVPWKTIEIHSILKLPPQTEEVTTILLGYDDDTDVIFLSVSHMTYMVQLKSMQSKKLYETIDTYRYHPFKSFYTPAIREGDEAGMLHDP